MFSIVGLHDNCRGSEGCEEEDSEEWGKNREMSKHVKENEGECRMERAGETQKGERILAFLTAHEMCGRMSNVSWYGNTGA